jgi:ATP-binding cassette, subfamily C, bacterial CydD
VAIASLAIYIGLGLLGYIELGPTDRLSLASGLFILLLAPEFFNPLRTLAQHWHDRADGLAGAESLIGLLDTAPARPPAPEPDPRQPRFPCMVTVEQLDFAWPGRAALFEQLNLEVRAGERLLIQGPSGCGKSTLISLLGGFMAPAAGRILLDSIDLAELDQAGLSRARSWLGQKPVLLAGSVAENIALGRDEIDQHRIEQLAEMASVSRFTKRLADGLDSPVGEDGRGFSGGQAQRIALARCLAVPTPLLLLDEPTASLDPVSEALIWQAISQAAQAHSMTVICASHSALAEGWATRIVRLEHGQLHEVAR